MQQFRMIRFSFILLMYILNRMKNVTAVYVLLYIWFIFTGISSGEYYYCIDLEESLETGLLVIEEGILNTEDL